MSITSFEFGVEGLDEYYPGVLVPGTLLVIAGYPGSGKTSLAAQLCYHNALKKAKCLYVSTQESEEKFLKFMKRFGFDFEYLITLGLFKFSRLPLIGSEEALDGVLESITSMVLEFNPKVIVVDSITPMAKVVGHDVKRRALIQNYFYNIAFEIGGLVVLITEIPLGEHTIKETGDIEFVADGILILKHDIIDNILSRRIEIRKLRGAPIELSEIPFTISSGKGIVALVPPRRARLKYEGVEAGRYRIPCKPLDDMVGELRGGETILVTGAPYDIGVGSIAYWAYRMALDGGRDVAIISYREDEGSIRRMLDEVKARDPSLADLVDRTKVITLDPTLLSLEALLSLELSRVSESKPGITLFLDVDILRYHHKTNPLLLERYLRMEKSTLRDLGILALRLARVRSLDEVSYELPLADVAVIMEDSLSPGGGRVIVYRSGRRIVESRSSVEHCFIAR